MALGGQRWQIQRASMVVMDYPLRTLSELSLSPSDESAYLENLKKAKALIEEWKTESGSDQFRAFIGKVQNDIAGGKISHADADKLIEPAMRLLELSEE